ncbi:hypothetical protein KKG08_02605 [Patescibacteria group bacterium]|nr:hypothetical protein [Patescibacteria group bacterium]
MSEQIVSLLRIAVLAVEALPKIPDIQSVTRISKNSVNQEFVIVVVPMKVPGTSDITTYKVTVASNGTSGTLSEIGKDMYKYFTYAESKINFKE